jgi:hypothetical protein
VFYEETLAPASQNLFARRLGEDYLRLLKAWRVSNTAVE